MKDLVLSNLAHRPVRTGVTVLAVTLGVILVLINSGLVVGMQKKRGERESNVGAELMFCREFSLTPVTALALPTQYQQKLTPIPGVQVCTPVGQYLQGSQLGIGFEVIEGVDLPVYFAMAGISLREGSWPVSDFEMVVDPEYARTRRVGVGSIVPLLNRPFRVTGIYASECGTARFKIKLTTLQALLKSPERCTFFHVKCDKAELQEQTAQAILTALPGNRIVFLRDLPAMYAQGIPAFNTFLRLVVGLAAVVSVFFIFLSMYTTIHDRQREIGILKSLGASRAFIVRSIQVEALLISLAGLVLGSGSAWLVQLGIRHFTTLSPEISFQWMVNAAVLALTGSLIGSFWPAWKAANLDPVKILQRQ